MKEQEIEKLRQLVSRTDMSGNQKVDWLVNFINEREQSRQAAVSGSLQIPPLSDEMEDKMFRETRGQ
jgi:hypothetical protein